MASLLHVLQFPTGCGKLMLEPQSPLEARRGKAVLLDLGHGSFQAVDLRAFASSVYLHMPLSSLAP